MRKKQITLLFVGMLTLSFSAQAIVRSNPPRKYRKIQKYLDQATRDKLAGVVVYVSSPKRGEWIGSSGYANLETKQPMAKDLIFSMGSVGKMYNAVTVLKLAEEGQLHLDDKIANFLPGEIIENMDNAKEVTVRHLLGHTSGWMNYDTDPELNRLYLAGKLKLDTLSRINTLRRYSYGKMALSSPGTEFHYSSTNYLLLAMIVDNIVPEGHSEYLRKLIGKQGFINTYYRQTPPQKSVAYYGDLNQDGIVEDLTAQTIETTNWFTGDDGVYAPIDEAAHFLQDLMSGKILNQTYLAEMKTGNKIMKTDTGLGLIVGKDFPYGFVYGHGGRGIATTADVYYFPKQNITVAIFCNNGLRTAAPGFRKTYNKMRMRIVKKLFLF